MDKNIAEENKKNLIDLGIISPSNNKLIAIGKRVLDVLSNPHKLPRWLKALFLDLRFGAYLGRRTSNGNFERGWWGSLNSNYDDLSVMFSQIKLKKEDVIVDIGCGKGRVFNFFLNKGIKNKLVGIEVDANVATATQQRLKKFSQIKIVTGSIESPELFPNEGTVFYLFNPFSETIVKHFAEMLENNLRKGMYKQSNRPLIVYYYCYHLNIFASNPIWQVKKLDTDFMAAVIYPRF